MFYIFKCVSVCVCKTGLMINLSVYFSFHHQYQTSGFMKEARSGGDLVA